LLLSVCLSALTAVVFSELEVMDLSFPSDIQDSFYLC
jgi:hypothetical protein